MKAPFEKFVVQSINVNEFYIRTTSPELIREMLKDDKHFEPSSGSEARSTKLMMQRCIFIDDAIREKMERES